MMLNMVWREIWESLEFRNRKVLGSFEDRSLFAVREIHAD